MKTIGLVAGMAVVLATLHGISTAPQLPGETNVQVSDHSQYRLVSAGVASGCTVVKGSEIGAGVSELSVGGACHTLLPELFAAKIWRDKPDGSIAFASADGPDILEFALSDGLSYESFRPGAPLVALVADGD